MTVSAEALLSKAAVLSRDIGAELFQDAWAKARGLGVSQPEYASVVVRTFDAHGAEVTRYALHEFLRRPSADRLGYIRVAADNHAQRLRDGVERVFNGTTRQELAPPENADAAKQAAELRRLEREIREANRAGTHHRRRIFEAEKEVAFWRLQAAIVRTSPEDRPGLDIATCNRRVSAAQDELAQRRAEPQEPDGGTECPPEVMQQLELALGDIGDSPEPQERARRSPGPDTLKALEEANRRLAQNAKAPQSPREDAEGAQVGNPSDKQVSDRKPAALPQESISENEVWW